MGVTMYVQQMLNPQPTDPMQAKLSESCLMVFTVFLLFFPAGLSAVLDCQQQYYDFADKA